MFLCEKHFTLLANDSTQARAFWHFTMGEARQMMTEMRWDDAIMPYGNAFDAAGILLQDETSGLQAERFFVESARELIYLLRKTGRCSSASQIFESANRLLQSQERINPYGDLLIPLQEAASCSAIAINQWLAESILIWSGKPSVVH